MKFVSIFLAMLPLTSFASDFATCSVVAENYKLILGSHKSYAHESSELLSERRVKFTDRVVMTEKLREVSYEVIFSSEGFVEGGLELNKDRSEVGVTIIMPIKQGLILSVVDTLSLEQKKVEYVLKCNLE